MSSGPEKTHAAKPPVHTPAAQGPFFRKAGEETFFGPRPSQAFFSPPVQSKLEVSQPDDPQEKEADSVADSVMRMEEPVAAAGEEKKEEGSPSVQRSPEAAAIHRQAGMGGFASHGRMAEEDTGFDTEVQAKAQDDRVSAFIARSARGPPAGQAKSASGSDAHPAQGGMNFESSLASSKGSGSPLPSDTRQTMESRFGADFSGVRIHTGSGAENLSAGISAQAFTHGNDIYFNSGKFNPGSATGSHLLAHELTHTIQQGASRPTAQAKAARAIQRKSVQRSLQRQEAGTQRNAAVEMAKAEVGKVSAKEKGPDGNRMGWERLLEFFQTTFGPDRILPEGAAFQPGSVNEAQIKKESKFKGDVMAGDGRTVLHNQERDAMPSWCGIFAFWALNKGGIPLKKWELGSSFIPPEAAYPPGHQPQAGDIAWRREFSHYALVAGSDGSSVTTINGNTAGEDNVGGKIQSLTHPREHWFAFFNPTLMMDGALRAPDAADTPGAAPARSLKELRKQLFNVDRKAESPASEDRAQEEKAQEEKGAEEKTTVDRAAETQATEAAPTPLPRVAEAKPEATEEEREEKVQAKTDLAARKESTADSGADKEIDRAAEAPEPDEEKKTVQAKVERGAEEEVGPREGEAVQRAPMSLHNRGPPRAPPVIDATIGRRIQRWSLSGAWDAVSGAISDAAAWVEKGLDKAKEWMLDKVRDFVMELPGYKVICLILGEDPITGAAVPLTGENLLDAGLDFMPLGDKFRDVLVRTGLYQDAAGWLNGRIDDLSSTASGIVDRFARFWDGLSLSDVGDPDGVLERVADLFKSTIDDLFGFFERSATSLISMIKDVMIREVADFVRTRIPRLYPLLCVALGFDPQTMQDVPRNGTNILDAFLAFSEDGEQEKKQMLESGTFQKAAAFIDEGIAVFTTAYSLLKSAIAGIWDFVTIENLFSPIQTFERIHATFAAPITMVTDYVWKLAKTILKYIKDAILGKLSAFARKTRGFPLLCVILGKDPFTGAKVERNVHNLVKGFMSLMDGGEEQYEQLKTSGAIDRIVAKVEAAVARLNLTPRAIIDLFIQVWEDLSIRDLARPIEAFTRIVGTLAQPVFRIIRFIIEIVLIVIEAILILMNFPFDIVSNILAKARQAWNLIKNDPVGFFKNLLLCIKQGFIQFFDNIATHLINGVVGWLMSELRDAGVPLLTDFSLQGVIAWVLEVLGISMEKIWEKLAAHPRIGPERVARIRGMINTLEGIWTFIKDVQERGMAAIWDKIQEQLSNLWDKVLEMVRNWIMEKIVTAVVTKLLSMLDPTGIMAVINSCIAIYKAVQSFIKYITEMLRVVNSFVEGLLSIAEGNIKVGADALEGAMGRAMPIVIGFLANQVGLGGIGQKIAELIGAARDLVDRAITWLVNKAVDTGMALIDRALAMGRSAVAGVRSMLGLEEPYTNEAGEGHNLLVEQAGTGMSVKRASGTPLPVTDFLAAKTAEINNPASTLTAAQKAEMRPAIAEARTIINGIQAISYPANAPPADATHIQQQASALLARLKRQMQIIDRGAAPVPPVTVVPGFSSNLATGFSVRYLLKGQHPPGQEADMYGGDMHGATPVLETLGVYPAKWVNFHLLNHNYGGLAVDSNLVPTPKVVNSQYLHAFENPFKDKYDDPADAKVMWFTCSVSYRSGNVFAASISSQGGAMKADGRNWIPDPAQAIPPWSSPIPEPEAEAIAINRLPANQAALGLVARFTPLTLGLLQLLRTIKPPVVTARATLLSVLETYATTTGLAPRTHNQYIDQINRANFDFT